AKTEGWFIKGSDGAFNFPAQHKHRELCDSTLIRKGSSKEVGGGGGGGGGGQRSDIAGVLVDSTFFFLLQFGRKKVSALFRVHAAASFLKQTLEDIFMYSGKKGITVVLYLGLIANYQIIKTNRTQIGHIPKVLVPNGQALKNI
ncbi:hypothetical protein ACJX0J_038090, partial [Zea mays]